MTPEAVQIAAQILADARRASAQVANLPENCQPTTLRDVYLIQDQLAKILGVETGGWFCGASSKDIQEQIGITSPYCARVFSNSLYASPAVLQPADFPVVAWECEFGFQLKKDLPPKERPYTNEEVMDAIAAVHPVLEAVTCRFHPWQDSSLLCRISDNGGDGAVIYGDAVEDWRDYDLSAAVVNLTVNGKTIAKGEGRKAMGNPLNTMTWLVNAVVCRGATLLKGYICNTGTVTGMYFGSLDDVAVADFGPLGRAAASFSPS